MSGDILAALAADLADAIAVVRPRSGGAASASIDVEEAVATALLGYVSEPGDGVLGKIVGMLGARPVAAGLLGGRSGAELAERAAAHDPGGLDAPSARELAAGLARWRPRLDEAAFTRSVAQAARVRARLLLTADAAWPDAVADLGAHAPLALWVRGRSAALTEAPGIALVGARAATGYGEHVAIEASAGLVDRGFTVVSGGAYGIDGTAHRSALAAGGTTVAFLAGGVDRFYPAGHETLLGRIAETGAVVSELSCGAAPTRWRFLQRNRLIAAASRATVVLEAGMRSGSLNTAGHAAALGRPLGAVPGPVTSPASAGCHRLLREFDAVCVTDAAQMAELVGDAAVGLADESRDDVVRVDGRAPLPALDGLTSPERRVLDALAARRERTIGELVRSTGLAPGAVMGALGALDATGLAARSGEGWVRRPPD
ncbi:DNA-processing protein DprA [Agromyces kandeliae]|uniref:DNA-protecting protein DprA n=1 Tax=Agromyces kandeliae TaxID=2666141 RepID=A0A6L5R6T6_9MICO|nr:DNA-processing protein DprA [Agromyces kandeliae]MRX45108.1 DNA-protecting protein DprA [Agromyces kandeliae]